MSTVQPNNAIGKINHSLYWAKSHEDKFGAASSAFPATLNRKRMKPLDQEDSEFCTAYGEAASNGYEFNVLFSGEWQTQAEGLFLGSPILNGADPYPSIEATSIMGSLPDILNMFSLRDKGARFIADYTNWPRSLDIFAAKYKSTMIPYYIDGSFDTFDNIRNALYQSFLANETGIVKAFGFWYQSWNLQAQNTLLKGVVSCPLPTEQPITRHRYSFIDWITNPDGKVYLVAALTQGDDFGDSGFLYFDRDTVNQVFANSIANGLGLYINRVSTNNFYAALMYFKTILAYLTGRVHLVTANP